MPISCPACARPNNERLTACLYCGEELPPSPDAPELLPTDEVAAVARAAAPSAPPAPRAPRPALLVLDPPRSRDGGRPEPARLAPERIAAVTEVLGMDVYHARKALVTSYPNVIARGEPAVLAPLAERLTAAGLVVTTLASEQLDALGEPFRATEVGLGPAAGEGRPVVFGDGERSVTVMPGHVRLLVRGTLRVEWIGAPRAAAGWRSALRESAPRRDDLEQVRSDFPVLEVQCADVPRVRISLAQCDFRGLGADLRPSALLNLNHVVALLRQGSPDAAVDEGFRFVPADPDPGFGAGATFGSNEGQFDRYARVVGAHQAALRAAVTGS